MPKLATVLEAETIQRKGGYTCSPRMAWNSGFWDGYSDAHNGRIERREGSESMPLPAWSPLYRAGYAVAYAARRSGWTGSDSSAFWASWTLATGTKAIRAMLAREEGFKA